MKKKHVRRTHHRQHHVKRTYRPSENYLVVARGWMLVVAFAVMLGVGAIVGTFINQQMEQATPVVAGAETAR